MFFKRACTRVGGDFFSKICKKVGEVIFFCNFYNTTCFFKGMGTISKTFTFKILQKSRWPSFFFFSFFVIFLNVKSMVETLALFRGNSEKFAIFADSRKGQGILMEVKMKILLNVDESCEISNILIRNHFCVLPYFLT